MLIAILSFATTSCSTSKLMTSVYGLKPVKVITSPTDAQVFDAKTNNYLGNTPIDVFVNPKAAVPDGALFTVRKDGYEPFVFKATTDFNKKEIKIRLHPVVKEEAQAPQVSRDNPGQTDMEKSIIRWNFDSDPRGARVFYRVISSVPAEVKNTNEIYLGTTPYEETRGFNIVGLTYDNSPDVTVEIKVTKRGYEEQVKRFNVRMAIDQQEIGGFFELVEK